MQDILDSGFDFMGLSNSPNSRSASMKKIKPRQTPQFAQNDSFASRSNRSSNDLINSVLQKDTRTFNPNETSSVNTTKRLNLDMNDFQVEEHHLPQPSSYTNVQAKRKPSINHQRSQADIFGEDHAVSQHFGDTQKSIVNPSKSSDIFVSSRNMKPPLRPNSWNSQSLNFGGFSAGFDTVIPEEDPALTNSSNGLNDIRSPRRSSIDNRSESKDVVFPMRRRPNGGSSNSIYEDKVKQDTFSHINKSQSCLLPDNKKESQGNFFRAKDKLQSKSESLKVEESPKDTCNCRQKMAHREQQIISDYEKQVYLLKSTYQKQITYLQECIDKQVDENRSLRAKMLQEANKLVEEERTRSIRLHAEEVERLKQVFNWQQKRQDEAYQLEITSLKSTLGVATEHQEWARNHKSLSSHNNELLQTQLQTRELRVQSKMKSVEQRQLEMETKEAELRLRMRREQEKLRTEERRLSEMESQLKKRLLEEKKALTVEREELALKSSIDESDTMKTRQRISFFQKEIELERQSIERQKHTLMQINQQSTAKHRDNMRFVQEERERLKEMEIDLLRKLRIVEAKAREVTSQCNQEDEPLHKMNNWLDNSFSGKEKKMKTSNSLSNLAKTKQRFYNLEGNVRATKHPISQ